MAAFEKTLIFYNHVVDRAQNQANEKILRVEELQKRWNV